MASEALGLLPGGGQHDLGELTTIQDWFLRYQLKTVPDIAEVATVGRMQRAWQVVPAPQALAARGISLQQIVDAIRAANGAGGGSVIVQGEAELMVRSLGYLKTAEDFRAVPVTRNADATPVLLGDIAQIRRGRAFRRGIPELDGEGEVVGGVIVLRSGKNALAAIQAIKSKLAALRSSLPAAVEIVPTYDRYPGGVLSVGALPFAQRPG